MKNKEKKLTQENNKIVLKYRSRQFCLVLYEDDETHQRAIHKIVNYYNHAIICHDMDVYENDIYDNGTLIHHAGEFKKKHYHIIIKFENARWNTSVADDLGIELNYIQMCSDLKGSLLYLIHFKNYDKHLYSVDAVSGPLKKDLIILKNKAESDENVKVQYIYDWINNQIPPLTIMKFSKWCFENGYWDVFRRSSSIFFRIIDEKNYNKDGFYPNTYYSNENIDVAFKQLGIFDQ